MSSSVFSCEVKKESIIKAIDNAMKYKRLRKNTHPLATAKPQKIY